MGANRPKRRKFNNTNDKFYMMNKILLKKLPYNYYREVEVNNNEDLNLFLSEGYLPLEVDDIPNEELYDLIPKYHLDEERNVWIKTFDKKISRVKVNEIITSLKQQLANTDYKVVKNMEYQMAMMSSVEPNTIVLDLYDAQELHNERQALRDKINELEQLLKGE
jgi:hypothetical protein